MKKLIVATAAAILLGAPLALAANTTTNPQTAPKAETKTVNTSLSDQCTALDKQFDQIHASHKGDKNYQEALKLHAQGMKLCANYKAADGVKKLESALNMIGVKPKM